MKDRLTVYHCSCCGRQELYMFECRGVRKHIYAKTGQVIAITHRPKVGEKVCYRPNHYLERDIFENGIVKEVIDEETVRVVYNCGGDWGNYQNYTAAATKISDLEAGWREDECP